jgi:hypothetical protein
LSDMCSNEARKGPPSQTAMERSHITSKDLAVTAGT